MSNPRNLLDFLFLFFIRYLHTNPVTLCSCAAYTAFIVYSKLRLSHTINLRLCMLSLWLPDSRVFLRIRRVAEGEWPTGLLPPGKPLLMPSPLQLDKKSYNQTRNANNGAVLRIALFFSQARTNWHSKQRRGFAHCATHSASNGAVLPL